MNLRQTFSLPPGLPPLLRSNFIYYFWDIAWWGFYVGSTAAFLAIYAARCGATPGQIGLLAAFPALTALLLSLPAGRWLRRFPAGKATVWSAFISRMLFLVYVFLPWILPPDLQVEALLVLAVVITLPTTIINISFSQMFVEAVPIEWRGMVVGTRMALMSLISFPVTLLCGLILGRLPFPSGYQVVFFIGFLGAILTVPVLKRIHPLVEPAPTAREEPVPTRREELVPTRREELVPSVSEGTAQSKKDGSHHPISFLRPHPSLFSLLPPLTPTGLHFLKVVFLLFFFNVTNNMVAPLVPDLLVNTLQLSDSVISLATALSTLLVFLVSFAMSRLHNRFSSRSGSGFGAVLLAFQAVLLALAHSVTGYLFAVVLGGLASGILASAQYNYHLDALPPSDRPSWLSWSLLLGSTAVLIGSLAGPALARITSVPMALIALGAARLVVGVVIWARG